MNRTDTNMEPVKSFLEEIESFFESHNKVLAADGAPISAKHGFTLTNLSCGEKGMSAKVLVHDAKHKGFQCENRNMAIFKFNPNAEDPMDRIENVRLECRMDDGTGKNAENEKTV